MKKNIRHFLLLSALAAGSIHLLNRFIQATADMKNILKAENGNYYDWKNGKIYYTKRGNGSPLLLIHDLDPASSSYEWCKVIRKLEKNHTVYTLDLIGCGRSDKPFLTYTNYLYVQLITDFIRNVIGEKTAVLTSNESVSFTVLACNMNKDLMSSILVLNPASLKSLHITTNKYASVKKTLFELPIIGTFLYNLRVSNTSLNKAFREDYYARPQLISSKLMDAYYEAAHRGGCYAKNVYANKASKFMNIDITRGLKEIDNSLYIVEGEAENNREAIIEAYQNVNPSVEAVTIMETKHFPHVEAPEQFLEQVGIFF